MGRYDKYLGGGEGADETPLPDTAATAPGDRYNKYLYGDTSQPAPPPSSPWTWQDAARAAPVAFGALSRGAFETVDDAVRAAANAATFGMADRAAGALNQVTGLTEAPDYSSAVNEEVKRSNAARERSPYASIAGDVAGSAALPGFGGARLAMRLGAGRAARALGYGAEGAGIGALQGAGGTYSENLPDYIRNAVTGGALGGVLGAGFGTVFAPRSSVSSAKVPSTAELYTEKTGNYRDLANSPALYEPNALAHAADVVEGVIRNPPHRFQEQYSPLAFKAIDEMRNPPTTAHLGRGAPVSPGDIEAIRQGITSNINPLTAGPDLPASKHVRRALDEFVLNPPSGAVLPGTERAAAEATALAQRARGNYGGFKRGQALDDLIANAETQAGSTHSGLNVENELRRGVKGFIRQKEGMSSASRAGYNPEEVAALTEYARGTTGHNIQRYVGNYLGGGGGFAVPFVGSVASQYFRDNPTEGALAGVAAQGAGLATRLVGNRRASRDIVTLGEMVRQRSPLYQERAAVAPMQPGPGMLSAPNTARARDAMALELLRQQQQPGAE